MDMNKQITQTILIFLTLFLALATNGAADDTHSNHQGMTTIRETMVDNHHLVYNLIDMRKRMKGMKSIPPMENTHHLMLYIHSPHNHVMENIKVGFLITKPDDEKQQVMAMAMGGGYGADINLEEKGTYKISIKAIVGDMDLRDSFEYER